MESILPYDLWSEDSLEKPPGIYRFKFVVKGSELILEPYREFQQADFSWSSDLALVLLDAMERTKHMVSIEPLLWLFEQEVLSSAPTHGGVVPFEEVDAWLNRKLSEQLM